MSYLAVISVVPLNRGIFPDPDDRTYVHVGCHFTRISPPRRNVSALVRTRINEAKVRWEEYFTEDEGVRKDKIETFVRFLSALLVRCPGVPVRRCRTDHELLH